MGSREVPYVGARRRGVRPFRALFKSEQKKAELLGLIVRLPIFLFHGRLWLPASYFLVFSMVRLGEFLYRVGWVISGLLLFDFPPTIVAYSGFVARLTNVNELVEIGFVCTAIACLSWLAGRALGYGLARIGNVKGIRERYVGSCRLLTAPYSLQIRSPHWHSNRLIVLPVRESRKRRTKSGRSPHRGSTSSTRPAAVG